MDGVMVLQSKFGALTGLVMLCLLIQFSCDLDILNATDDDKSFASWQVAGDRPNIVLIISDDQRWSDYGFMDHPLIETPNLDRLARQSALFSRGYVPTALCRASLMTLITGRYAFEHRTCGNDPFVKQGSTLTSREL